MGNDASTAKRPHDGEKASSSLNDAQGVDQPHEDEGTFRAFDERSSTSSTISHRAGFTTMTSSASKVLKARTPGTRHDESMTDGSPLPNLIVIGAMKAGTTALHQYLGRHPDIQMSDPKELCFFYNDEPTTAVPKGDHELPALHGSAGNLHRGISWYTRHFDPHARARGESSPGYTSPSFPEVASRMASVIPNASLVFLVRDPVSRAVSQYRHHVRDGTEQRSLIEALSDPTSHYVLRSKYAARLSPFLRHFTHDQIVIAEQEDLAGDPITVLSELLFFVGVRASDAAALVPRRLRPSPRPPLPIQVIDPIGELVAEDAAEFRDMTGRRFATWSI